MQGQEGARARGFLLLGQEAARVEGHKGGRAQGPMPLHISPVCPRNPRAVAPHEPPGETFTA